MKRPSPLSADQQLLRRLVGSPEQRHSNRTEVPSPVDPHAPGAMSLARATLLICLCAAAAQAARIGGAARAPRYTDEAQADLVKELPGWSAQEGYNIFSGCAPVGQLPDRSAQRHTRAAPAGHLWAAAAHRQISSVARASDMAQPDHPLRAATSP
jgi:hypothetical protein